MYEAFDKFLAIDTWHTTHPLDGKRFFQALDQIVRDDSFNADSMAGYMRRKFGVSHGDDDYRAEAIERYATAAWAVREYLEATGAI